MPADPKKKPGTEVFDPIVPLDADKDGIIEDEPALDNIQIPTLPPTELRIAARDILSAVVSDDTFASLLAISGTVAILARQKILPRIAIGGHFQAILDAVQKDVMSDGDVSPSRQKFALQLTYDYIHAVHGYNRPLARNHMLIYRRFAGNAEARRLLSYSEMVLLASQVKHDDIVLLIDEKRESDLSAVEFKALTRDYVMKLG